MMENAPPGNVFLLRGYPLSFQIVALLNTGRKSGFGLCAFPFGVPDMRRPNPGRSNSGVGLRLGVQG
jgi:hypothetical protein